MPRLPLLLLALLATALVAAPAADAATVRRGPAGDAFYKPPKKLPGKRHGDVIWTRKLSGAPRLTAASANTLVLYRSVDSHGKATAVSGSIALPKGKAPKGGWPVVTWAHGTTGIADVCAPTRDDGTEPVHAYSAYAFPLLNRWLKAGYAVLRTDYQGLGTPGTHGYLIGVDEGRSTLDIVRAARKLYPKLSKRYAIAGHSQGGHAALWAGYLAPRWTPELKLRGTVAFAPAALLDEQVPSVSAVKNPGGGLSSEIALIIRGLDYADPSAKSSQLFTDKALAFYPDTLTQCQPQLSAADSFGGLSPAEMFKEQPSGKPVALLDKNDPDNLKLPSVTQVEQGETDATVFKPVTDQLVKKLKDNGSKVRYATYPDTSHSAVVVSAADHATKFLKARLGR
jgi:pimeloyl-ACP methyl ester carboxylesterase